MTYSKKQWLLNLASCGLLIALMCPHFAQAAPGFAKEPTITEYDVDPSWPKYPENVSQKGWVSGMASDKEGNIWVFRKGPDPVQVYRPDGSFVRTWGKGMFQDPHQMRIDKEGNIWLADFGLHIVEKFTPDGKRLMTLGERGVQGDDETHFFRPTDMAIAENGDIFVTDGYGNRRVMHFNKNGDFINQWGSYGTKPGQFVIPHAIQIDSKGLLYVADRNSGRVQIFNQQGEFQDQWSNVLMPWGLYVTPQDEVWVCGSSPHWWYRNGKYPEYKDQVIVRFSTDGRVQQTWGIPMGKRTEIKPNDYKYDAKPGETLGVHCIVKGEDGILYVGDIYGERAQKFIPITERAKDEEKAKPGSDKL